MSAVLTAEQALKLVGEMFVYHMPFNRALGMELERYEKEFAQLAWRLARYPHSAMGGPPSFWRNIAG